MKSDDNLVIIHHNVHTLESKCSFTAAYPGHVVTLNETDLPEYNRKTIEAEMRKHDKDIIWGANVSIDSKFGKTGRRVAIFADSVAPITAHSADSDDPIHRMLIDSGRWVEAQVPVKDGSEAVYVATLYGISGANQDQQKHKENEVLLAAAPAGRRRRPVGRRRRRRGGRCHRPGQAERRRRRD